MKQMRCFKIATSINLKSLRKLLKIFKILNGTFFCGPRTCYLKPYNNLFVNNLNEKLILTLHVMK